MGIVITIAKSLPCTILSPGVIFNAGKRKVLPYSGHEKLKFKPARRYPMDAGFWAFAVLQNSNAIKYVMVRIVFVAVILSDVKLF
jgi:hypothetical protein